MRFFTTVFLLAACLHAEDRLNVIFIFIDDMGYADPSCFGNPVVKTPNIDKLAADGMRFTQFYVNSPICSPSRVAVTTGQYPARHLIHSYLAARTKNRSRGMTDFLCPGVFTIGDAFKNAGYATAHFGKWHMGGGRDVRNAPTPQEYGFDESLVNFEGMGERIKAPKHEWTKIYVDRTIDFINRNKEKPFFVRLFPNDVHDRHVPPPGNEKKWETVTKNPFERLFFAVLEEMDRQLGRVFNEIEKLGLEDRTVILFTSDNGPTDWPSYYRKGWNPPGFAGPFNGRKWSLYEGGIHMPFIVKCGGKIPAGKADDTSVFAGIDLLPTLCSLTGIPVPKGLDGIDVSQAWLGKPITREFPIFWEYGRRKGYLKGGVEKHQSPSLAVRDKNWKLLMDQDGSRVELYDLAADQKEETNLAAKHPELVAALKTRLMKWRSSLPELPPDQEAMRATTIGYDPGNGFIRLGPGPAPKAAKKVRLDMPGLAKRCQNHDVKITKEGKTSMWKLEEGAYLDMTKKSVIKVAGAAISINARIQTKGANGVILAHGGDKSGYSLFIKDGKPTFSVCVNWKRTTIASDHPLSEGASTIAANLGRDGRMQLSINGKPAATGKAASSLRADPGDSLQVGADLIKPVGDYEAGNFFEGKILELKLQVD